MVRHTDMEVTVTEEDFLYSQIPRNRRHSKPCGGRYRRRYQARDFIVVVQGRNGRGKILVCFSDFSSLWD